MDSLDCLIIGAGISGLAAAQEILKETDWSIQVLDKGRGPGGRVCTRRRTVFNSDGSEMQVQFDHGAQFFTAKSKAFQEYVNVWEQSGLVVPHPTLSDHHPRWICPQGLSKVARALSQGVPLELQNRVTEIRFHNGLWQVLTEQEDEILAHRLILTSPVPQSLALLEAGQVDLPETLLANLKAITYKPTWTVMIWVKNSDKSPLGSKGVIRFEEGEDDLIEAAFDNRVKGVSEPRTLTVHMQHNWSLKNLEKTPEEIVNLVQPLLEKRFGVSFEGIWAHRWRYAKPEGEDPGGFLLTVTPGPLGFCGDAFKGGRVEGAFLSGIELVQAIKSG